jgi:hypothetical protein
MAEHSVSFFMGITIVLGFLLFFSMAFPQIVFGSHCVQNYREINTIAISCGTANLFDLSDQIASNTALSQESKGVWVLKANIVVGNSATLNINSTDPSWLKINSTGDDPYHIAVLGNLNIDSVKVSACSNVSRSNDELANGTKPRPYIAVLPGATGNVTISNSELSCLGYNFPLREGIAVYGGEATLLNNKIHDQYYGFFASGPRVTNINNTFSKNFHNFKVINGVIDNLTSSYDSSDDGRPFIAIRSPVQNSTISSTSLQVQGTAFDEESGIKQVEIFEHTFPFDNKFPYRLAEQSQNGSWLSWKYTFNLNKTGLHRVSVKVTDNAGNENWAEVRFKVSPFVIMGQENASSRLYNKRIALVGAVFTDGAYNKGGFYEFYQAHQDVPEGQDVYTDLHLLTSHIPYSLEFDRVTSNITNILGHILQNLTKDTPPVLSDEDLHEGYIFKDDGTNAYDVLFMLHEEYVTKQEYMNLKRFVSNGGVIVFIDGNVFYAQVSYNPDMHTVTLLSGHDWSFNGKFAEKNIRERWLNENKDWMGSNFLWSGINADTVFTNNPFNYSHFEENYISNPDDHIIYDYHAVIPPELVEANSIKTKPQIATYSLEYGKGKVIMLGIYGQHLLGNPAFTRFLSDLIFPQAAGSKFYTNGSNIPVYYYLNSGNLSGINKSDSNLTLNFERTQNISDDLLISIPIQLIRPIKVSDLENMTILLDGKTINYSIFVGYNEVGLRIHLTPDSKKLEILQDSLLSKIDQS